MASRRIIAYFMHESERTEAASRMANSQMTESYIIGDIEDADIAALQSKGIICQEVAEPRQPETPGIVFESRTGGAAFGAGTPGASPSTKTRAARAGVPLVYLIQLRGPVLEEWRTQLSAAGVKLLESVPPDTYTARLTTAQVTSVSQLSFVEAVIEYGPRETGPAITLESAAPPTSSVGRNLQMFTFDARLHEEADREAVLRWLNERHIAVAGSSGRKIRFYVLETSTIPDDLAALAEVAQVERFIPPQVYNDVARDLMGIDTLGGNPGAGLNLTGNGQIVGIADTGLDAAHPDFTGRIAGLIARGRIGDSSDPHGHGTHVAGSVLGDGSASGGKLRGAAPGAKLFFQSVLDAQGGLGGLPLALGDLFEEAYQAGARVHNNSWGSATASLYTMNSSEVDEFIAKRRDMLVVISAGNDGSSAQPQKAKPGFVDWLSIGSPASAKNALVVGASRSKRTDGALSQMKYRDVWPRLHPNAPIADETVSGNPEGLAAFSSRGPCDDRRIKPDVVAPGTDIASTKSSVAPLKNFWGPYPNTSKYAFMGGTSMAAPLVAGTAALVREYFASVGRTAPSAALLKATLINGARRLTATDSIADHPDCPNYHQGFGCVDLRTTIPNPTQPALKIETIDTWQTPNLQFVRTGQRQRYAFKVSGNMPLRMCLAWTDLPARGTQNSLAFMVQGPSNERWVGNTGLLGALTTPDPDNNVHILRLDKPSAGDYLVQIFARNLLRPPQDFAFIVNGDLTTPLTLLP
jgi:subtilisin family serine protease